MRRRRPDAPGHLTSHRAELIRDNLDEVLRDYPGGLAFSGSDKDDYHVHAAAVACGAHVLLTNNDPLDITTSPDDEPYEIMCPDEFFLLVADSSPAALATVTRDQVAYWGRKEGARQLDDALNRAGCPQFAERVRTVLCALAHVG